MKDIYRQNTVTKFEDNDDKDKVVLARIDEATYRKLMSMMMQSDDKQIKHLFSISREEI